MSHGNKNAGILLLWQWSHSLMAMTKKKLTRPHRFGRVVRDVRTRFSLQEDAQKFGDLWTF